MSLRAELKRRNVFRVAIAYLVFGWLVLQIADVLFPALQLPDWSITLVAVILGIGLIAALIFSWIYELTPEGLKRESEVERGTSVTHETGRKLNVLIAVLLVLTIGVVVVDWTRPQTQQPVETGSTDGLDKSAAASSIAPTADGSAGPPVIAVLPFKATGSDDGGFLAAGLHDDLLTRLAKLGAFRVISRTSMMEYGDTAKNMRLIGEELGAGYILEGGVQALGQRVRINAQLIDAPADQHIWAEVYDHELTANNLFDVQAELAMAIAGALQTELTPSDLALVREVPTENTEAYNAYLRGLELRDKASFSRKSSRAATSAFERAVELDPGFALAWAQLSIERSRQAQMTVDPEMREQALVAQNKARELQPDLQEVELARVVYLYRSLFEYRQALEALEALEARSTLDAPDLMLKAWLLRRLGRSDESYRTALDARRLDPRSVRVAEFLIYAAYESGDCEAAGRHVADALALSPDLWSTRAQAARYEVECTGDAARAADYLNGIDFGSVEIWVLFQARDLADMRGDYDLLLELTETPSPDTDAYGPVTKQLWRVHALRRLDRREEAAALLDSVGEQIETLAQDEQARGEPAFAWVKANYHANRGDAQETRYWFDEHRRRFREAQKGNLPDEAWNAFIYAYQLAMVGLKDDAIAELRNTLSQPGGHHFRYVDAFAVFDGLKNEPGYVALREEFGD